ncbi:MAG: hypothetical protein JSU95_02900 [Betaproteobacteria bacterium]|nr:MAG: hypothetical protein JSU95_02900 [Betaproteobacteria bacterium]
MSQEKITAIRKALSKNFKSAPVRYLDGDGCHHFNLELPRVTHRVNFALDVVEQHEAASFKRLCKNVAVYLQRNPTGMPRQVLLTRSGIVEEDFESDFDDTEENAPKTR